MTNVKTRAVSGKSYFKEIYQIDLELEAQWLQFGAVDKVNSIEFLLNRHAIKPTTILELGCGTGAVITECQRRGLGEEFTAVDYSREAIEYLKSHSQGINCIEADITDPNFTMDRCFDVIVLSHVLEHLEEPLEFLQSLTHKFLFRNLVAEVPLEGLWASQIKNHFRDRTQNISGHVQFFTDTSFLRLLSIASLEISDYLRYVPIFSPEVIDFICRKNDLSRIRTMLKKITCCYLPRYITPIWSRIYYAHFAVLCAPLSTSRSEEECRHGP